MLTQTPARPVSVRLRGAQPATAHLQRAARGQKTRVTVALASAGGSSRLTAEIAIGSCSKPTALTSTSVLGPVRGSMASWTTPTPFAQLAAARAAVVLRSARRPVVACGNVPRR